MSILGTFLLERRDALLARWLDRVRLEAPSEGLSAAELRDHVPHFVAELADALHGGLAPSSSRAAQEHGRQREDLGFDVSAVVREYGLLLDVVLDFAEAEEIVPTVSDVRIATRLVSIGIDESVAAHQRHQDRISLGHDAFAAAASRRAEAATARIAGIFRTAPAFMAALQGPNHVYTLVNEPYERIVGVGRPLVGLAVAEALPEMVAQGFISLLDEVYRSGVAHTGREVRVRFDRRGAGLEDAYIDFVYQPTLDATGAVDGIDVFGFDVTEQYLARQRVEALLLSEQAARREADERLAEVVRLRELIEVERDLATAVADLETKARRSSDEARARTEFLLDVASTVGQSLDLAVVFASLVDKIAPAQARIARVWTTAGGEPPRRQASAPVEATAAGAAVDDRGTSPAVLRVLATSETLHIVDYAAWMAAEGEAEAGKASAAEGICEVLVLPIRRGADTVAILGIGRGAGAPFEKEDIAVFESVARLAALAYENSRLYGEMAALRRAAEDATLAKDRFLAHVSHDLRNPLGSILGWATLLREMHDVPPQMKRGIDVIERNARAQQQLVDDLLDVSRIASGKLSLVMAAEDVRFAIEAALDSARLAAAAKKIGIVVVVPDESGAIAVDPDRFRQIVWNLVSNAVKFTPNGGTVRVTARRTGPVFELVVEDSGRGIAPEFLPRVFESFEQAEAGQGRTGGLGLGLAIVKKLVELHGGTVRAESDGEGKGARFTVDLPIRAAIASPDVPATNAPGPLTGIRLLVVDDEEDARDVVSVVLEHAGATVTGASSVDDALDLLLGTQVDAIVSDIAMPGRDGKDLVRQIRSLPAAQGGTIPVVALTAFVSRRDRQEILAAGFDAHVAKPVEAAELVGKIAELVGRKLA